MSVLHYDSDIGDHLEFRLSNDKTVKCTVTYLYFRLPDDATYNDPTAYLQIYGNIQSLTVMANQLGKNPAGVVIPICEPKLRQEVRTPFIAKMPNAGELQFRILDKTLNKVATSRLVVTISSAEC